MSSRASSPTSASRATPSAPSSDVFSDAGLWGEIEEQRDRFVASTEADLAAGGEHVRVRPGKEFVVRLQSYGVELGPDGSLVQGRVLAASPRRRERVPGDVVEARVRGRLVLGAPARGGRAHLVAALAPRLQRQAPAEGLPLPRRRGREHGPVPVRRRQPPPRPVLRRVGLGAPRPALPDRGGARVPHPAERGADVHGPGGHAPVL